MNEIVMRSKPTRSSATSILSRRVVNVMAMVGLIFTEGVIAQETTSDADRSTEKSGTVIVELFTSQGCSSCPPADQTLTRLDEIARQRSLPVHVLSFHVDYWNRLGWQDPYSDAAFTDRQRQYARTWQSNRVYTPQMVVDGVDEFVGSHSKTAGRSVAEALTLPDENTLEVRIKQRTANVLTLTVDIEGALKSRSLVTTIVESPQPNDVPRGENSGRQLVHTNVVRVMKVEPIRAGQLTIALEIPTDIDERAAAVIAYVQKTDGEIVGAVREEWPG